MLSLLNPHDIQFYPRGFRADFKRPDYGAEPEPSFYAEPTLGDKPTRPRSASATSSSIDRRHAGRRRRTTPSTGAGQLNTYYDLIVGTDEMLGAAIKAVDRRRACSTTR